MFRIAFDTTFWPQNLILVVPASLIVDILPQNVRKSLIKVTLFCMIQSKVLVEGTLEVRQSRGDLPRQWTVLYCRLFKDGIRYYNYADVRAL